MLTFPEIQNKLDEMAKGYENLNFKNLEVTIQLETPVCFIGYFYLDGILQYQTLVNLLGPDFFNLDKNEGLVIPVPLAWVGKEKKFPACSIAQFEEGAEGITRWRKRWDSPNDDFVDFGNKKERVEHKAGHFKCYDMPLVYHSLPEIKFYCVGNAPLILELLEPISFIGKKRSQGFGKVRKVFIDEIKEDYSVIKEGVLTRPVPVEEISLYSIIEGPIIQMGYKAPYYWPENIAFCFAPGSKVTR